MPEHPPRPRSPFEQPPTVNPEKPWSPVELAKAQQLMAEIKRLQGIFNTHGAYTQEELAAVHKARVDYEKLINREYWSLELPEAREARNILISLLTERAAPDYFNLPQVEAMLSSIPLPESPKDLASEHITKVMDYFGGGITPQVPLDSATFAALTTGTKEDGTSEPYSLNSPWCAMMNPKDQHPKDQARGLVAKELGFLTSEKLIAMNQELRAREGDRATHPAFTFIDNAYKPDNTGGTQTYITPGTGGRDTLLKTLRDAAARAGDPTLQTFFSSRFNHSWNEWATNLQAISDIITQELHQSGTLPHTIRVSITLASFIDTQMFYLQEATRNPIVVAGTRIKKSTQTTCSEWTSTLASGVARRLLAGGSEFGGLSYVLDDVPAWTSGSWGARLSVSLVAS
jgi:hypothetical protein